MAENGHAGVGNQSCCPGLDQGPGEFDVRVGLMR
jgi:hypothetical protein